MSKPKHARGFISLELKIFIVLRGFKTSPLIGKIAEGSGHSWRIASPICGP